MLDLIQLKSGLENENFKKDIQYIDELTQITLNEYGHERLENEFLKTLSEINIKSHIHLDHLAIDRITEGRIKYWNSKFSIVLRKTSQLENDAFYVTKDYADKVIRAIIIDKNVYLESSDKKIWSLKVDDNGVLFTVEITEDY